MKGEKNGKQILCIALLISVSALFLCSFAIINFKSFPKFCNCDMYEDTVFSMLAWKSKSFFPDGWVFGNQYYIFATPVVCALFYGITENINLSMALATTIMTLLIAMSMLFLIYPFTDKVGRFLGVAAILGCMVTANAALSLEGQLFYILASYYSGYLITILIVTGDYLHALCFRKKRNLSAALILSLALCFATGMQSLRQTAILILPILSTEILRILILLYRKDRKQIFWTRAVTLRAFLYTASNLLGVLYIRMFNVPHVEIYGGITRRSLSERGAVHEVNMRILQKITGFYYAFHEKNGLIYFMLALFFTGVVVTAAIISLRGCTRKRDRPKTGREHLFGVTVFSIFTISLIELFVANHVFDINFRMIYMFVWYPLTAISCVVLMQQLKTDLRKLIGVVLLCAACVGSWYTGYAPVVQSALKPEEPCTVQEISDYIVDNGFAYIYGDWSIVCPIATYTNGRALGACSFRNPFEILGYINPQGVYGKEENKRAVYVFFGSQNLAALQYASQMGAKMTLIKEFDGGSYTLYISDKPLMHYGTSSLHDR
ncbi:MAG: hypothetical protein CVU91_02365 [Firmicutes bacterium HGW-Firmicutes-16]|nr:MAG: hypothetical protein CVU91_02365 [Firmicutes bacterium HGW-Firmicutes-16]